MASRNWVLSLLAAIVKLHGASPWHLRNRTELVGVAGGWHVHVGILIDLLNGREPKPFWSKLEALEAEYDKRLPQTQ